MLLSSILWLTLPDLQCTTSRVRCTGYATAIQQLFFFLSFSGCWNCGGKGHLKSQCPSKAMKTRGKRGRGVAAGRSRGAGASRSRGGGRAFVGGVGLVSAVGVGQQFGVVAVQQFGVGACQQFRVGVPVMIGVTCVGGAGEIDM